MRHLGGVDGHLVEQDPGLEAEHARIPEESTRGEVFPGLLQGGLLDEADHRKPGSASLASLDVAKTRLRSGGHDAECHQFVIGRQFGGHTHGPGKSRLIMDEMVGRQHQHQGVTAMFFRHQGGGQGHGWRSVAPHGFEQENALALGTDPGSGQLILAHEVIIAVGHRQ